MRMKGTKSGREVGILRIRHSPRRLGPLECMRCQTNHPCAGAVSGGRPTENKDNRLGRAHNALLSRPGAFQSPNRAARLRIILVSRLTEVEKPLQAHCRGPLRKKRLATSPVALFRLPVVRRQILIQRFFLSAAPLHIAIAPERQALSPWTIRRSRKQTFGHRPHS